MISLFDTIVRLNKLLGGERFQRSLESNLKSFLTSYQNKIADGKNLTPREIADIARDIVISQYFNDRNHRTAILFCYFYYLINNRVINLKPYQLYAAIKRAEEQFFKTSETKDNHIFDALSSSCFSTCSADEQVIHFESIKDITLNLHETLQKIIGNNTHLYGIIEKSIKLQQDSYKKYYMPLEPKARQSKHRLKSNFPKEEKITALIFEADISHVPAAAPSPVTVKTKSLLTNLTEEEVCYDEIEEEVCTSSKMSESYIETSFNKARLVACSPLTIHSKDEHQSHSLGLQLFFNPTSKSFISTIEEEPSNAVVSKK